MAYTDEHSAFTVTNRSFQQQFSGVPRRCAQLDIPWHSQSWLCAHAAAKDLITVSVHPEEARNM
jgi:hypothetical protein